VLLGADSTHVRNEIRRFLMRLVPPLPKWERGLGGEGHKAHPNASNTEFAHMFCPSLSGVDLRRFALFVRHGSKDELEAML
jgi:hypothetical protein